MAFFILYVAYVVGVFLVARHLTGFSWSSATRRLFILLLPIATLAFLAGRLLPIWQATGVGVIVTLLTSVLCLRGLVKRIGFEHRIVKMSFRVPGIRWVCGA